MKAPKDIWTACVACKMAFLARNSDEPYCPLCKQESKDQEDYDKQRWKE